LFVLTLPEVGVPNAATRIDYVQRRPVVIVEGAPDA
jgi:hypothetical protein